MFPVDCSEDDFPLKEGACLAAFPVTSTLASYIDRVFPFGLTELKAGKANATRRPAASLHPNGIEIFWSGKTSQSFDSYHTQ